MAFNNLFVRTKRSLGGIELDGVITESHSNVVAITKQPIELGADITDHSTIEPKVLNIEGVVTDTPLGVQAFNQIIDTVTGLFGSATVDNQTRSVAAYNALLQLQEQREPISVQTRLRLYENMIITSIDTVQDKDTSKIALMKIRLEEIIIAQTDVIPVPQDVLEPGPTQQQASSNIDRGRQNSTEPTTEQSSTLLKSIADFF